MNVKLKDPDKYTDERLTRLKSQADAEKTREHSVDSLRVRLPQGMREQIQSYVITLPEYTRTVKRKDGRKDEPNVNKWVIDILTQALPEQYRTWDIDNKNTE